ncbi:hypothetical protein HDU96_000594 [Phlyctochytrium bullatum]|nr:hypothetical protein HDU96_000594 [Phlyctochytrium bullatum]
MNVIHNDIKCQNIFLTGEDHELLPRVKLGDFDLASMAGTGGSTFSISASGPRMGTGMYWPPAQWASEYLDRISAKESDVYAFGVVLTELASWIGPYGFPVSSWNEPNTVPELVDFGYQLKVRYENNQQEFSADPIIWREPVHWGNMPEWFKRMTRACLDVRPDYRPTMEDIVRGLETEAWPPRW